MIGRMRRKEIALEESINCHNSQGEQSDGKQNQTMYSSPHKGRRKTLTNHRQIQIILCGTLQDQWLGLYV